MALYEYRCSKCGYEFEEFGSEEEMKCKKCGSAADKRMSSFAAVIAGGSPTETVDKTIGREAEKRWQSISDRQSKRRADKKLEQFTLPKALDGKYMPVMGLGDNTEKGKRQEYTGALQEHRQERIKKGQPQFTGVGTF